MPAHCAGGNTGIFVNGRELHQRDLDVLHGRGFPTDRGKSYTIEMSGRVLDEQTGEELYLANLLQLCACCGFDQCSLGVRLDSTKLQFLRCSGLLLASQSSSSDKFLNLEFL
ncbi:UNVERIFIED_CONTAM: hypothetical protein Slati_3804200 [Sesamum latifolium]|uniref:Uncharacterized protein n=1 Tax=Sesamum latifolium TaxID=2727402 RepID=A0AAW2U5G2_9LAMI